MSAVRISLPSRNNIPLPVTSISTKQLCPGDDRSYTYISRMSTTTQLCDCHLTASSACRHLAKFNIFVKSLRNGAGVKNNGANAHACMQLSTSMSRHRNTTFECHSAIWCVAVVNEQLRMCSTRNNTRRRAINGTPGCGKATIVAALANRLAEPVHAF